MRENIFDLNGRVAIVTGANTGLGQGIAVSLAQAGADIVTVGRSPATETADQIRNAGSQTLDIHADLISTNAIPEIIQTTLEMFGKIDILVNNAGTIRRNDATDFSEADWDDVMNINIKSAFFLSQAAGRKMIEQGYGKIINIASMLSFQGGIRVPSYTASKSAMAGVTRLLANEWASKNVNVNAIAPGYMVTNNTEPLRNDPKRSAEILTRIPAGRWGDPADVGGTAVFLASHAADYINGAIIPVDGGWLAR